MLDLETKNTQGFENIDAEWSQGPATFLQGFCSCFTRSARPRVLRISGEDSSMASVVWQVSQSCVMVFLSAVTCASSWHRKQPGKSVCPRLFAYVPQVTLRSGKTFRM